MSLAIVKYVTGTRKIAREIRALRDDVKIFVPRSVKRGNDYQTMNKGMREFQGDVVLNCLLVPG